MRRLQLTRHASKLSQGRQANFVSRFFFQAAFPKALTRTGVSVANTGRSASSRPLSAPDVSPTRLLDLQLKCSRTEPCQNCTAAKTTCEYREVDRKRVPVSHDYVASLESRLAWLESFVKELRASTPEQRDEMLRAATLEEDSPVATSTQAPGEYVTQLGINARNEANLELGLEGSLVYHGATSIFRAEAATDRKAPTPPLFKTTTTE